MSNPKPSPLEPALALFRRVKAMVLGLSRPAKILAASTAAAVVLIAGYVVFTMANEPYTALFTNLDREDAAALIVKLKEKKVPYRLQGDGTTIEVPESKVRETRLDLAGSGLPRGAGVGFESFDKVRLGATEFEQRVLFRRALEGELARTFGTLGAVQSARVHLVLPERSVFVSKNEPASASIVVKLKPGASLGSADVAAMVNLAGSSVPGLSADRVTLVTTEGTMLHRPRRSRDGESSVDDEDERTSQFRALESGLEERTRAMLERVLGAGHVDVRVTADVDRARVERVEDHYDPRNGPMMRTEQWSVERATTEDANTSAAGIPGAESNLPDAKNAANGANAADGGAPAVATNVTKTASGVVRESHNRAFEIDHVSEKRILPAGTLRRITVAVVVDGAPAAGGAVATRTPEELAKLTSLVRSAVGADDKRGDVVTVESMPFTLGTPEDVGPTAPEPLWTKLPPRWRYAVMGGAAVLAIVLFSVVAVSRKRAVARAKVRDAERLAAAAQPAMLIAPDEPEELSADQLREAAHERALRDPATAALVLRFWLSNGEVAAPAAGSRALGDAPARALERSA